MSIHTRNAAIVDIMPTSKRKARKGCGCALRGVHKWNEVLAHCGCPECCAAFTLAERNAAQAERKEAKDICKAAQAVLMAEKAEKDLKRGKAVAGLIRAHTKQGEYKQAARLLSKLKSRVNAPKPTSCRVLLRRRKSNAIEVREVTT